MDETEFRQILEVFPVVRSRDYHADSDSSSQVTRSAPTEEVKEWQDARNDEDEREAFWGKLKSAAEEKTQLGLVFVNFQAQPGGQTEVGAADAEIFCKAFQQIYKKLVYEELSLDAARNIINSWT